MGRYTKHVYNAPGFMKDVQSGLVPEKKPLDSTMVTNRAGGYTFKVDELRQFDRWLVLGPGSESGTYYASKWQMTTENARLIAKLLGEGKGIAMVDRMIEMRASVPKLQPIFFAAAMIMASDDVSAKSHLVDNVSKIAWTAGQFLELVSNVDDLRGWGRSFRRLCQNWYGSKSALQLAKAMTKYRNRQGWRHRDVLLKASVKPADSEISAVFKYVVARDKGNEKEIADVLDTLYGSDTSALAYLRDIEDMWVRSSKGDHVGAAQIALRAGLPWEVFPTQMLNFPEVWEALLPAMQPMAMLRNLNKMSALGMTGEFSNNARYIISSLTNEDWIVNSKVHPIEFMQAHGVYRLGRGLKGSLEWDVNPHIVRAIYEAFLFSFKNVEPIGKRTLVSVDESGSMGMQSTIGLDGIMSAAQAAALMAMVRVRSEAIGDLSVIGFSWNARPRDISNRLSYDEILRSFRAGGGTNGAATFEYINANNLLVDYVEVHTDNEVWAGQSHFIAQARQYRRHINPDLRVVVFAYSANRNTIASGEDWTLDVVGLDSNAPAVAGAFARGEF